MLKKKKFLRELIEKEDGSWTWFGEAFFIIYMMLVSVPYFIIPALLLKVSLKHTFIAILMLNVLLVLTSLILVIFEESLVDLWIRFAKRTTRYRLFFRTKAFKSYVDRYNLSLDDSTYFFGLFSRRYSSVRNSMVDDYGFTLGVNSSLLGPDLYNYLIQSISQKIMLNDDLEIAQMMDYISLGSVGGQRQSILLDYIEVVYPYHYFKTNKYQTDEDIIDVVNRAYVEDADNFNIWLDTIFDKYDLDDDFVELVQEQMSQGDFGLWCDIQDDFDVIVSSKYNDRNKNYIIIGGVD